MGLGRASLLPLHVSPAQAPRPLTGKSDGRWAEAGGSQAGTRPGGGSGGAVGEVSPALSGCCGHTGPGRGG